MAKTATPKYTSKTAHKHDLYELAVQDVRHEAGYIEKLYKRIRGKPAVCLKEDFSGTSSLCCEWVRRKPTHTAVGVDNHRPTLNWGRKHRLSKLTDEQRSRVTLIEGDVLEVTEPKVDIIAGLNFSYYCFHTRPVLRRYFEAALASLKPDGVLLLDSYGGADAMLEDEDDPRECDGFTYIWDHAMYNPITGHTTCHIHFEFDDGSKMRRAFTYKWRLWTLPEIQELLLEAGFSHVDVLWEGTDEDGEGNGVFRKSRRGEACEGWVAYLVAQP